MKYSFFAIAFFAIIISANAQGHKQEIVQTLGTEEYERLMSMSSHEFDQTYEGFRQYSGDYELIQLLIPEYISVNSLTAHESRNLHWHLGQMHGFNGNIEKAISEMEQSFEGGSVTWACYVNGSIAFLKKDKVALESALELLRKQDNQMNIEILEKFVKYFDNTYAEAYNAPY